MAASHSGSWAVIAETEVDLIGEPNEERCN